MRPLRRCVRALPQLRKRRLTRRNRAFRFLEPRLGLCGNLACLGQITTRRCDILLECSLPLDAFGHGSLEGRDPLVRFAVGLLQPDAECFDVALKRDRPRLFIEPALLGGFAGGPYLFDLSTQPLDFLGQLSALLFDRVGPRLFLGEVARQRLDPLRIFEACDRRRARFVEFRLRGGQVVFQQAERVCALGDGRLRLLESCGEGIDLRDRVVMRAPSPSCLGLGLLDLSEQRCRTRIGLFAQGALPRNGRLERRDSLTRRALDFGRTCLRPQSQTVNLACALVQRLRFRLDVGDLIFERLRLLEGLVSPMIGRVGALFERTEFGFEIVGPMCEFLRGCLKFADPAIGVGDPVLFRLGQVAHRRQLRLQLRRAFALHVELDAQRRQRLVGVRKRRLQALLELRTVVGALLQRRAGSCEFGLVIENRRREITRPTLLLVSGLFRLECTNLEDFERLPQGGLQRLRTDPGLSLRLDIHPKRDRVRQRTVPFFARAVDPLAGHLDRVLVLDSPQSGRYRGRGR